MRKFTLFEAAQIIGASFSNNLKNPIVNGVCVDSRLIQPGQLFFALPGDQTDGHEFIEDVFSKGAIAAVVKRSHLDKYTKHSVSNHYVPLIYVDDTLEALQILANYFVRAQRAKIIGITGSLGKTTTKDFLTTLLKEKYSVASSPGNSNSKIGLPLAIINHTTGNEDYIVLEMGMTHPGQIEKLVKIAPPDITLITTIDLVHAINFDSIEGIAKAKAEIFSSPKTRIGILPYGMPGFEDAKKTGSCKKITFSTTSEKSDYYLSGKNLSAHGNILTSLPLLNLPGNHNLHNLLAAMTVSLECGLTIDEIKLGIPKLSLPERRLQTVNKNGIVFINDSYNATMTSVKAALAILPQPQSGGRKIAVLGEMLELGKFSNDCHREVGETALKHVDMVYCLGKECLPISESWKTANKPVELFMDRIDLVNKLRSQLKEGDVVLLKGSRSKQMWKVLDEL